MGVEHEVSQASSPQAALVVVAQALDRIEARLDEIASQPATAGDVWDWRPAVTITDDVVTFGDAPPELKEKRAVFAQSVLNLSEALPELGDDAIMDFVNGGPIWLHAYNRDYVLQVPIEARQMMVQDVDSYDPAAAADLARDILKDGSPGALPDFTPTH